MLLNAAISSLITTVAILVLFQRMDERNRRNFAAFVF